MKKLIIGPNIKTIGEHAFNNCDKLEEIVFCGDINSVGRSAFSGCDKLKIITKNKGCVIKKFDEFSFSGCTSLEKIDEELFNGTESVGAMAFNGSMRKIYNVKLYNSLTHIGEYVFTGDRLLPLDIECEFYLKDEVFNKINNQYSGDRDYRVGKTFGYIDKEGKIINEFKPLLDKYK